MGAQAEESRMIGRNLVLSIMGARLGKGETSMEKGRVADLSPSTAFAEVVVTIAGEKGGESMVTFTRDCGPNLGVPLQSRQSRHSAP